MCQEWLINRRRWRMNKSKQNYNFRTSERIFKKNRKELSGPTIKLSNTTTFKPGNKFSRQTFVQFSTTREIILCTQQENNWWKDGRIHSLQFLRFMSPRGDGEANDLAASKRLQARSKRMTQYMGEETVRGGGCNLEMWEMREDSAMEGWDEVRGEGEGRWTDCTGGRERMAAPITELLKCLRAILSPRCKMERRHPALFLHRRDGFARVHRHRHCIRVHRAWSSSSGQCFTPLLSSRRSFPWLPYFHAKWIELFRCRALLLIILRARYKSF